jgi:dihydrofolate reductase
MGKVILDMSMSLDGFIAGSNVGKEYPMGVDGESLHTWLFSTPRDKVDADVECEMFANTGAVILGNRTFEVGVDLWEDVPFPAPSFVLTHKGREKLIKKSGTFTFVTDGIESALQLARAVAGDKDVRLMGADVAQQFLSAGLIDEIQINHVPILLGAGVRLFEHPGIKNSQLEKDRVLDSPHATHIRYRLVKEKQNGKEGK